MKINGNEIRPGNVLEHQDSLWAAVKVQHVKPGKGGAFAQEELKNLLDGRKLTERFRSADTVARVRREQKAIGISLPHHVTLEITEADAVVKGQTASASYKPAILENGVKVTVPPFIGAGEKIVVDTQSIEYIRRGE